MYKILEKSKIQFTFRQSKGDSDAGALLNIMEMCLSGNLYGQMTVIFSSP